MKYSIIIPVYGVEKYIAKCLDSVLAQTYENFEVLVINDGSKDNSQSIIDKYTDRDKRIKSYIKENGGLSDARNYGIKRLGKDVDYILFLDSDDYIEANLLEEINCSLLKTKVDVIKYRIQTVDENYEITNQIKTSIFENIKGEDALVKLMNIDTTFVTACSYAYNRKFWLANNFEYPLERYHEDNALTPYILAKANYVTSIDYVGYNYLKREDSITGVTDRIKLVKRAYDLLKNTEELIKKFDSNMNISKSNREAILDFFAKSAMFFSIKLKGKERKKFVSELKKRNLLQYLSKSGIKRKIKYMIMKISLTLYFKIFYRR